ncbi:MAG: exo-alpha-sialidase [Burkholderiales bacterium]|nr:exo-alpha-sialidase [Burkholderiales bacterium]
MRALLSTRKGLFELSRANASATWQLNLLGFIADPVTFTLHDKRDGCIYAALKLGHFGVKLHRRELDGTWHEIAVPTYPAKPEDVKADVEWKLVQIWSMAAGGADQPGVLWAGTLPGGLFRSEDRGDSWQLVESLWHHPLRPEWMGGGAEQPGIHSICVDPSNSQRILLGVSTGGAWRSDDGGVSWQIKARGMFAEYMPPEQAEVEQAQDPHLLVQCASAPQHYWCQHHNGIWRSQDGAESWQRIKPVTSDGQAISDFGFAVAVHPHNPEIAWFAPGESDQRRIPVSAAMSVHRTRDGGKSFEVLRQGLPQKDCYDLVYRHCLAISDDGNSLLMGSTTGGLWITENGGDDWLEISHTLPPIYALQFA